MKITYEVKFLDYWHIGSGVSGGALYDMIILKDKNNMPYIPGKTLKGLVRENIEKLYGEEIMKEQLGSKGDKLSKFYFSNAYMDENEYNEIVSNSLQNYLYDTLTFTKINKQGVAENDTLREFEVVLPVSLYGEIEVLQEDADTEKIKNALKMIKRMGLGRNRGLGRCEIIIKDEK